MLMVIFGAGASFDSAPGLPHRADEYEVAEKLRLSPKGFNPSLYRPPLANQLFENRPPFAHILHHYPQCRPIVPLVRHLENRSLEQVFQELQSEAAAYPKRLQQLTAVRFYLQELLWNCVTAWRSAHFDVTNHEALLDQIELHRQSNESVCLEPIS